MKTKKNILVVLKVIAFFLALVLSFKSGWKFYDIKEPHESHDTNEVFSTDMIREGIADYRGIKIPAEATDIFYLSRGFLGYRDWLALTFDNKNACETFLREQFSVTLEQLDEYISLPNEFIRIEKFYLKDRLGWDIKKHHVLSVHYDEHPHKRDNLTVAFAPESCRVFICYRGGS